MKHATHRLLSSTRGATLVQYIVLVGVVALAAAAGFRAFGGDLTHVATTYGGDVRTLDANIGGGGSGGAPVCTGGTCTGGSNCFVAGTLVQTPEGPQPIEQIRAGDVVISEDEATGAVVLEPVLATFVTEDRDVVDVYLRGDPRPIRATPGHRFFTRDAGWVVTEALLPDEPLVALDGSDAVVDRLEAEGETRTVYNFEVESTHTYFVGDGAPVLVHNPMTPTGKPVTKPGVSVAGHTFNPPDPSTTAIIQLASDSPNAGPVLDGTAFGYQQNLPGSTRLDWTQLGPGSLSGIDHVIVISHGVPGKVQYGSPPKYVDGTFVANVLTNAGYTPKPGSEVFLSACNGGTVCMPNLLDTSLFNFRPNKQTPSVATQMANSLGTGVIAPVADDPKLANVPQNNRPGNEVSQFSDPTWFGPDSPFTPQQPVHGVIAGGFKTCTATN